MVKMCTPSPKNKLCCTATAPPKNRYVTVLHCNRLPPRWNFPTGATGAGRAEAGGAGACGAGAGGLGNSGKVSAGIPDQSSEGFLTTHRSHCSKTLISGTAPQPPHRKKYIKFTPLAPPPPKIYK